MMQAFSRPAFKQSLYPMVIDQKGLLLCFSRNEGIVCPAATAEEQALWMMVDGAHTAEDMAARLRETYPGLSLEWVLERLRWADDRFLLEDWALVNDDVGHRDLQKDRYHRQQLFFAAWEQQGIAHAAAMQKRLTQARVALLGAGGIGTHVLFALMAAGVGWLRVVDHDQVDVTNLNRQGFYNEGDVGRRKVEVLAEKCPQVNSSIAYEFKNAHLDSVEAIAREIADVDMAVLLADSPREHIFRWANRAALQTGTPLLFTGGVSQNYVRVGPFVLPGKTPCFQCGMPKISLDPTHPLAAQVGQRYVHGAFGPFVMTAGSLLALEALKHLTGFAPCKSYGARIHLNLMDYTLEREMLHQNDDCPDCGSSASS